MDLRQLRHFVAVAELRSFTAAAGELHMSQPALSQSVARLEKELGCALLHRNKQNPGQGVLLTVAGETLLEEGRDLIAAAQRAEERTRRAGRTSSGVSLAMGFTSGTPQHLVAAALAAADGIDGVDVYPVELDWGHEHQAIVTGRADLAYLQYAEGTPVAGHTVTGLELLERVALVPTNHRLAHRGRVTLADLAGEAILDPGSAEGVPGYRDLWLGEPRPAGMPIGRIVGPPARTVQEMYSFVAAGRGMAIASKAVADQFQRDDVVALVVPDLASVEVGVARLVEDRRPPVRQVFDALSRLSRL
ncbi:LysR family transcriptional regulator [Amnibacterium flavum]|uniref:HTH lysR-type domain-containing protein n=1 Tax=Amnibacterium flavum TaxID=2173173 RepID=A0A2V1HT98_9MICO|nr:LysR family transcriptional regulator [Amnibacterium flavum]PVZ95793.1 hypothetical protein DDQ50_04795 [Amnibacterium flavum]